MAKKIIVHYEEKPCYTIALEDSFERLNKELEQVYTNLEEKRICIISDTNVFKIYGEEIMSKLALKAKLVTNFVFEAGESSKNLDTVNRVYEKLIKDKFDRKDVLVALGGGVVGDLTGFAAATYLRGIDFVQIPTSLLSQVDSSIGGKTGVDYKAYKNMVGAFYQPKLVYINVSTLKSLDDRQFNSGMGEIIKHGLIKNREYYFWLKENKAVIENRDEEILIEMIYESCKIKRNVVEIDPKEQGERALLNFGHTIGHAVEKLMNFELCHGECVAIGSVAAAYMSYKKQLITIEELNDIIQVINEFDFPMNIETLNSEEIIEATKNDKKMSAGKIKFILLKQIGEAYIDIDVSDQDMLDAIEYIKKKGWCSNE